MLTTNHSLLHARTDDGRPFVDYECALELLEALVHEKGDDFTYTPAPWVDEDGDTIFGCSYATRDEETGKLVSSCGVGVVLFTIEPITLEIAHAFDPGVNGRYTGLTARGMLESDAISQHIVFERGATRLLALFQFHQDARKPYRTALNAAILDYESGMWP